MNLSSFIICYYVITEQNHKNAWAIKLHKKTSKSLWKIKIKGWFYFVENILKSYI